MFNGSANLGKSHRRKHDKSYSEDSYFLCCKTLSNGIELRQDWYLSMRRLSNLSPLGNLSHCVTFPVDLFNTAGAVAGNPRFRHMKTVLCWTVFNTAFQITILRSYGVAMFVLHVESFKALAMFAQRSRSVKKTLWSPSNGPFHSTSPAIRMHCRIRRSPRQTSSLIELWMILPFSIFAMNPSRCYSCMESLNRLKIHMKHIYYKHFDRADVDDISLFHPHISLSMVFETFKAKLRAGILERKVDRRSRRLIYYCPGLILSWELFQIDVESNESNIRKPVWWKSYASPQDAVIAFVVPRVVITIFPYGGGN